MVKWLKPLVNRVFPVAGACHGMNAPKGHCYCQPGATPQERVSTTIKALKGRPKHAGQTHIWRTRCMVWSRVVGGIATTAVAVTATR